MAETNKHEEEMTKKQFLFRGKTIEELKALDVREFAKYLKSTPRRYLLRNFQKVEQFLTRSRKKNQNKKQIKTHDRELLSFQKWLDGECLFTGSNALPL